MNNSNIEFVSYTGAYPVLCCGVLTVKVNGKKYVFGERRRRPLKKVDDYYPEMLPKFWSTGGHCGLDENFNELVEKGPWEMSPLVGEDDFPKEIWKCLNDILEVFSENITWGCCGGCI